MARPNTSSYTIASGFREISSGRPEFAWSVIGSIVVEENSDLSDEDIISSINLASYLEVVNDNPSTPVQYIITVASNDLGASIDGTTLQFSGMAPDVIRDTAYHIVVTAQEAPMSADYTPQGVNPKDNTVTIIVTTTGTRATDDAPIEVSIGIPGTTNAPNSNESPYRLLQYVSEIRFTKSGQPVSITNFTVDDIMDEPTGGTATKGTLTSIVDELGAFELPLTFSGVGSVTLTIEAGAAMSATQDAPTSETEVTIYFDTTQVTAVPSGTNVTILCTTNTTIENNPFGFVELNGNRTGQLIGEMECVERNGSLYGVSQVQYRRQGRDGEVNDVYQASAALWRRNLSDCSLTILKRYSDITIAARSLEVVGDDIFFFEGSHYAYKWNPRNREWPNLIGNIRKITPANEIKDVAFAFRSQGPSGTDVEELFFGIHGGTASPLVAVGNDVYFLPGFGNVESITHDTLDKNGDPTIDAARINNWALLKYTETLDFRLEILEANDQTGQNIFENLGRLTNSFFFIDQDGELNFEPKIQRTAQVSSAIPLTAITTIEFKNPNRDIAKYPTSGSLLIGNECFTYNGIMGSSFIGVQRAQYETSEETHAVDDEITIINHVFDLQDKNQVVEVVEDISLESYYQYLYNSITIEYAQGSWKAQENRTSALSTPFKDDDSIAKFNEEKLPLNLSQLAHHQSAWVDWLGNDYLRRYKDLQYMITIDLQPSAYLKHGDVVLLQEKIHSDIFRVGQVVEIGHRLGNEGAATRIKVFTF